MWRERKWEFHQNRGEMNRKARSIGKRRDEKRGKQWNESD